MDQEPELLREPPRLNDGRDELNLAEFPLCAIAHRLQPGQKTLVFEDRVWDENRGDMITRHLTITGSDAHGLPTALDDEVLLGLIQLSKLQNFAHREVHFTRYQLIQVLGWRAESKSYERIEESLNRWTGVTLYYKNAWRSKADQCWVDEKFHVLDNVTLYHRNQRHYPAGQGAQSELPLSSFAWNEILFRSFCAGNLKRIDFDFIKQLDSAIAKRLYRFLDKRFFHRGHWEFDLKEFAWEHIGLARSYDAANLKRKLRPGIVELEQQGYLRTVPEGERFRKVNSGDWRVVFDKVETTAAQPSLPPEQHQESQALVAALVERGVTPSSAHKTVAAHPAATIQAQLEVFDWMVGKQDPKVARNPPGFLISAIRGEYAPPKEFLSRVDEAKRAERLAERQRRMAARQLEREQQEQEQERKRDQAIQQFWESLTGEERTRLETEALAQAPALQHKLLLGSGTRTRADVAGGTDEASTGEPPPRRNCAGRRAGQRSA